jgi:hypothetical protein
MVRTAFFSFNYGEDNWRAAQVRNSDVVKSDLEASGFIDGADWEEVKQGGDEAIEAWIDEQMKGCSVTVLLIGSDSYGRKWIDYEIKEGYKSGMGIVGVKIHNIKDQDSVTTTSGKNPLDKWSDTETKENLSDIFQTYGWVKDDGRQNLKGWIEEAAQIVDR